MTLAEYTLAAMLHFAPVAKLPQFPGHEETPAMSEARYGKIAEAIAESCAGSKAPRDCAALLVALGAGESHFARDADLGPCHRKGNWRSRCDGGRAASVWQLQRWAMDPSTGQPYTLGTLFGDRKLAARLALQAARSSLGICRKLAPEDRLSALGGSCKTGMPSARARFRLWQSVKAWKP